jgi:uracil-DNA glycosylase
MLSNHNENCVTSTLEFSLANVDRSWHDCIKQALTKMHPDYLNKLLSADDWLPGKNNIFNAFSLPVDKVNYVLFGESPYPRIQSANGYAFWDANVKNIWSEKGLSKEVNRATSLRNMIKMFLLADGRLTQQTDQPAIAALDKSDLVQTNDELFQKFLKKGFLLLNATPVLQSTPVRLDARAWKPFISHIMHFLIEKRPCVEFILFGNIANEVDSLIAQPGLKKLYSEHPYNISFINNTNVLDFFRPLCILRKE